MHLERLSYLFFLVFAFSCSSVDGNGDGSDQINRSALSFGNIYPSTRMDITRRHLSP